VKALVFEHGVRLRLDHPEPALRPGWAVIDVALAGICRTDLEIVKGYMGFSGVLGHEFVGRVAACDDAEWIGRRVVAEINAACGRCGWCAQGMGRHCPNRTVLGIQGLDGCLAERCAAPTANLHAVADDLSDDEAVFAEPLAAAHEILEQVVVAESARCVVMGDGKLGILCAWVLSTASRDVTLVGRHERKLARARWGGVKTALSPGEVRPGADLVVEATGTGQGLMQSLNLVRPRGTLVLKSTVAAQGELNLAAAVVNEVTVVGSRCGPFDRALKALRAFRFPVGRLIDGRYRLEDAEAALARAGERGVLKVLVEPSVSTRRDAQRSGES